MGGATRGEICRQPVYYILLAVFALLLYASQYLTLFTFSGENQALREVALASLPLWGFVTALVMAGPLVTQEFEMQTAVTLLAKPLTRTEFLLGKYLGLMAALGRGLVFLFLVLLLTLWVSEGRPTLDTLGLEGEGLRVDVAVGAHLRDVFGVPTVLPMAEGTLLAAGQSAILAAFAIGLAAFFPVVVTAGISCFVYLLGHLTPQITGALDGAGGLPLTLLSRILYTVLPHLENFRDASLDRGGLVTAGTLVLTLAYAALYAGGLLAAAAAFFKHRDIA